MFIPRQNKTVMDDGSWYERPLDLSDSVAGGSLLLIGFACISLYLIVLRVMRKQDKVIVGYRFLISAGLTDVLLLVNYGVWPGLTILFKSEIIPRSMRHWLQLYLDWVWFATVWHYSLISWSRWAAIRRPHSFRHQRRRTSYLLCSVCYVIALVQVLATHFQPWYVVFYYEPASYGMLSEDFQLYMSGGQSIMFLSFHIVAIIPPIILYTWSVILLIKRRRSSIVTATTAIPTNHNNIESRLLLPCVINTITFVIGQIVITYGTGEGKWAGWTVMLLFCANSVINPVLLLICSTNIRNQVFNALHIRRNSYTEKIQETVIYRNQLALGEESPGKVSIETAMNKSQLGSDKIVYV